jgi:hypothetical protein
MENGLWDAFGWLNMDDTFAGLREDRQCSWS